MTGTWRLIKLEPPRVIVDLPADEYARLEAKAHREGITMNTVIVRELRDANLALIEIPVLGEIS
jgi:hypothetical protein